MTTLLVLLAEAAGQAAPEKAPEGGLAPLLITVGPVVLVFLVINHFFVTRPQQREQTRHQDMIGGLKKNDRVLTNGGIIGTVVSLSEDKKEITLRVDDNVRLKFRTEYIRGTLDGAPAEPATETKAS